MAIDMSRTVLCLLLASSLTAVAGTNPFDDFHAESKPWDLPYSQDPIALTPSQARNLPYYDQCMANKMKGVPQNGLPILARICTQQSIPKKCRDPLSVSDACLNECKQANFFTKKYGSCSLGE